MTNDTGVVFLSCELFLAASLAFLLARFLSLALIPFRALSSSTSEDFVEEENGEKERRMRR